MKRDVRVYVQDIFDLRKELLKVKEDMESANNS